jgi:hypothetical protein
VPLRSTYGQHWRWRRQCTNNPNGSPGGGRSEADIEEALSTPEGQAAAAMLIEDERNFIDFSRSSIFMAQEYEIF